MCWLSFCAGIEPFSLSSDQLPAANLTLQLLEECFSLRSDIFSISPAALPTPSTRCGGSPLLLEVASAVALTTRASEMIKLDSETSSKTVPHESGHHRATKKQLTLQGSQSFSQELRIDMVLSKCTWTRCRGARFACTRLLARQSRAALHSHLECRCSAGLRA